MQLSTQQIMLIISNLVGVISIILFVFYKIKSKNQLKNLKKPTKKYLIISAILFASSIAIGIVGQIVS